MAVWISTLFFRNRQNKAPLSCNRNDVAEGGCYLKIMLFHSNMEYSGNETQIGDK